MTLDEIKTFVKDNLTDADLPKNREPDIEAVEKQVNDRLDATYKNRLEFCGKNPIKTWFYLGRGKDKKQNVYYRDTPFDNCRKKSFYRWRKRIERHGVLVKRPYFGAYDNFQHNYKLFKFYDYTYSNVFRKMRYAFDYSPHCSIWDMSDLIDYLIVKLTIMGVYHGGRFSHVLYYKQKMHSIWQARKMLIEAINADDIYDLAKNRSFQEKYHININYLDLLGTVDEDTFIKTGKVLPHGKPEDFVRFSIDPTSPCLKGFFNDALFTTEEGRKLILEKCDEMEKFWFNIDNDDDNDLCYISLFNVIKVRKAFEFISEHFFEWGD